MRIVADKNVVLLDELFGEFGEITRLPGRGISREALSDADVLLTRSVTTVDKSLLDSTPVKFVGTSTSGFDHVDTEYLAAQGIAFAHAPGSNARSVAEYMVAALLRIQETKGILLRDSTVGIVGYGHVGSAVCELLSVLEMRCAINDPPRARTKDDVSYRLLEEALGCDFVSLHVPLTLEGPDATHHLMNAERFATMKEGAVFVNAARGGVVDSGALTDALEAGRLGACVLDVWENEPAVDWGLVERVDIATPHIAGHSYDGKVKGSYALRDALRDFLGKSDADDSPLDKHLSPTLDLTLETNLGDAVHRAVSASYDIMRDDAEMRRGSGLEENARAEYFDGLRNGYRRRGEFPRCVITAEGNDEAARNVLCDLGFGLREF